MKLVSRIIEPKNTAVRSTRFSNRDLQAIIVPLVIEQFLQLGVSLIDTLMVSYAGEAVVSGVALVGLISMVYLSIFGSLATGGAVVVSQYLGSREGEQANRAGSQIFFIVSCFAIGLMTLLLLFGSPLLAFLYGKVEPDVMAAGQIYLRILSLSLPATAVYNAGCAVYRSMGKTRPTMVISILMNLMNVAGNAIGIFALRAGAAGVAWPSTISWYFAAITITILCLRKSRVDKPVTVLPASMVRPHGTLLRRILHIAIPNMISGVLFSGTKVALGSIVSLFGTVQITANGISQTFGNLSALMGSVMGTVFITVIGRCMGAKEPDEASYYMKKLVRLGILLSFLWNVVLLTIMPFLLKLYNISDEARRLIVILVIIHATFSSFVQPIDIGISSGLRAAGDVRFTMYTSIFSTVIWRLIITYLLSIRLGLGVIGTAVAMVSDWTIHAICVAFRFRAGKWRSFKVI